MTARRGDALLPLEGEPVTQSGEAAAAIEIGGGAQLARPRRRLRGRQRGLDLRGRQRGRGRGDRRLGFRALIVVRAHFDDVGPRALAAREQPHPEGIIHLIEADLSRRRFGLGGRRHPQPFRRDLKVDQRGIIATAVLTRARAAQDADGQALVWNRDTHARVSTTCRPRESERARRLTWVAR